MDLSLMLSNQKKLVLSDLLTIEDSNEEKKR